MSPYLIKLIKEMETIKKQIERFLNIEHYDVVGFYPYTSIVTNRLLSTNPNYETECDELLKSFYEKAMEKAKALGCREDNKIAIELKPSVGGNLNMLDDVISSSIFVGYKDNTYSIGLSVFQPDLYVKKYNKKF